MHSTNMGANVTQTAPDTKDRAITQGTLLFLLHLHVTMIWRDTDRSVDKDRKAGCGGNAEQEPLTEPWGPEKVSRWK